MKKFLVILVILAIAVVGGGWYAKKKAAQVISSQVTREINSPTGQKTIKHILQSPKVQAELKKYGDTSGSSQFSSQQAAVNYAVSKLSPGEMVQLAKDYSHRDSLSATQKTQIETQLLSKFTPQQLAAMAETVNK